MSALSPTTDIARMGLHVRDVPMIGIGGASRLRPSHTTVRTGPYTAVRKVELTRFEQGWETERFEVSIGEPHREGFPPGDVPRPTPAAGRVARKLPRDSQCDQCRSATPWCFPLAPESRDRKSTRLNSSHLGISYAV